MRRPDSKRLLSAIRSAVRSLVAVGTTTAFVTLGGALGGAGCAPSATGQDAGPGQASLVSVGVRFTHHEDATRAAAVEAVTAQGQFARFRADQAVRAAALLGVTEDGALPIDTCRVVDGQSELDRALAGETSADVQLLDAGRILVRGPVDAMVLVPRHYPPLTAEVGGVFYDAGEAPSLTPVPGAVYGLAGQGGEEVGPFATEVTLPKSFPLLEAPAYLAGADLELRWAEPDEATSEPLTISVAWSGKGARPGEVRCRVRDDGAFTVGRDLLVGLPPEGGEVTLTRVRRSRFFAAGAEAMLTGEATLALAEVAPLPVGQVGP